jgi:hypothetical protein
LSESVEGEEIATGLLGESKNEWQRVGRELLEGEEKEDGGMASDAGPYASQTKETNTNCATPGSGSGANHAA